MFLHKVQSLPHGLCEWYSANTGHLSQWHLYKRREIGAHSWSSSSTLYWCWEAVDVVLSSPPGPGVASVAETDHNTPERSVQWSQLSWLRVHHMGVVQCHHASGQTSEEPWSFFYISIPLKGQNGKTQLKRSRYLWIIFYLLLICFQGQQLYVKDQHIHVKCVSHKLGAF